MGYFTYSQIVPITNSIADIGYTALKTGFRPSSANANQVFTIFIDNTQNGTPITLYLEQEANGSQSLETIVLPVAAGQCLILGGFDWSALQYLQGVSSGTTVNITLGVWSGTGAGSGGYYNPAFGSYRIHTLANTYTTGTIAVQTYNSGTDMLNLSLSTLAPAMTVDKAGIFVPSEWFFIFSMQNATCTGSVLTIKVDGVSKVVSSSMTGTTVPCSGLYRLTTMPTTSIEVAVSSANFQNTTNAGWWLFIPCRYNLVPDTGYTGSSLIINTVTASIFNPGYIWLTTGPNNVLISDYNGLTYTISTATVTTDPEGASGNSVPPYPIDESNTTPNQIIMNGSQSTMVFVVGLRYTEVRQG